ncbi:MAG TPA: pyruvate synthase [Elusimicrobia bacterium]|nr:MAG: pyruvate synthase [Elusimicrobia bacterium RIFOXYA12_FULL_49_49]OGS09913.1 MAG: pyruvate synthase [Elusimicrobia bacterium RIFOXYB1_FULL_48_9]OGS15438.1 MAG: pyruvate synthase [Elusimicrobia bacterium RIFOXYA2_FULL_47_53]OGS30865.1 MAG: pyruvate synthase [Elusimicrobia bacterium RIFOXYB2_FULL_46_23]HBU69153.1 pyruvate synthase [Elusimicrobiota bacterium]
MAEKKMIEIRWHGRGGQGAKTAALLFAETVLATGKYVQAFPEYGPERMGAPVQSFDRISDSPITVHCAVTEPDFVVILDPSLMDSVPVTDGIGGKGKVIVNTSFSVEDTAKHLGIPSSQVYVVNASQIAVETIGMNIPNTPMFGALVKVVGDLNLESVLDDTKKKLELKFRHKPQVIEGNLQSIRRAFNEVQGA